ncbi:MAG TPA: hypothetical protein HA327_07580 [Candidatus Poseidoniaceae archaeon]|nr:MAG TPA: hypothetical protein D7H81_07520 [Candidatus Poseidoniales archaeon]HII45881.1 hypothetical protein [Candidatus Poseidoniaceae archaeon]
MTTAPARINNSQDMTWSEVFQLSKSYLKIPLALLFVEAIYWFITQPSNTLVPIQISEAWIWHGLTNLIYGEGTATLTTNNGWMTQVNLQNDLFPGALNTVALYVSDECAGVHEMLFISTLIVMTDGVSQRVKLRSIVVMCGVVYVLNIIRLVAFYPIAVDSCALDPNNPSCLNSVWQYHEAIYSWGFLLVLVVMWLVWFWKVGGPSRAINSSSTKDKYHIALRQEWNKFHVMILGFVLIMLISSAYSVTTNTQAMQAKETLEFCSYSSIATNQCMAAQNTWDNAISTAWSLAAIGLLVAAAVVIKVDHKGTPPRNDFEVE